jgi:hypothetical protein
VLAAEGGRDRRAQREGVALSRHEPRGSPFVLEADGVAPGARGRGATRRERASRWVATRPRGSRWVATRPRGSRWVLPAREGRAESPRADGVALSRHASERVALGAPGARGSRRVPRSRGGRAGSPRARGCRAKCLAAEEVALSRHAREGVALGALGARESRWVAAALRARSRGGSPPV